jgi:hypothetical protein
MTYRAVVVVVVLIVVAGGCSSVSQQPDLVFEPTVSDPVFPEGDGPVVLIDGGHHNFHTADGGYAAFAKLLRRDGYVVRGSNEPSTPESLARGDIFVIANALAESDVKKWRLPTSPAFTGDEVPAAGMYQGAVFRYGEGRVAVFGEAAMFSAQKLTIDDRVLPMGMNAPEAAQNPQFLLNIMHWLSGLIGN